MDENFRIPQWQMDQIWQRPDLCTRCEHCINTPDTYSRGKCKCKITKRNGSTKRANYCKHFARRLKESENIRNPKTGLRIRSVLVEDYRTRSQWKSMGYELRPDAVGEEMHPVKKANKTYMYFLRSDVRPYSMEPDIPYADQWDKETQEAVDRIFKLYDSGQITYEDAIADLQQE